MVLDVNADIRSVRRVGNIQQGLNAGVGLVSHSMKGLVEDYAFIEYVGNHVDR